MLANKLTIPDTMSAEMEDEYNQLTEGKRGLNENTNDLI